MSYDQAAMAAFAQQVITDCNGRMVTPTGESLNMDGRYGWQCMDLFIYIRYHLGFTDWLPTPDAASVWELNSQPDNALWKVFDGITPDRPCYPGDIGIMNREFFNNGVGHIFMIVTDLGSSIRVLELNGLGDGREDAAGNQYGSPARIHDWPKTNLYGYLRWIGPTPGAGTLSTTIIPTQEDDMSFTIGDLLNAPAYDGGPTLSQALKDVHERSATIQEGRAGIQNAGALILAVAQIQAQLAILAGKAGIDPADLARQVAETLANGVNISVNVQGTK